jgi:hypothetical protein
MDESPTKEAGKNAWLWAVVTPLYAVYPSSGVVLARLWTTCLAAPSADS